MPSTNFNAATSRPAWSPDSGDPASSRSHGANLRNANSTRRQSSSDSLLDGLSGIREQRLSGASTGKGKAKAGADDPPRYDEIYQNDGDFLMPNGQFKLLNTDEARRAHMQKYGMNTDFIHPTSEEAGAIFDKKPVFVIDTSGSMNLTSAREERFEKPVKRFGLFKTGKKKTKTKTVNEPRWMEQESNTKRLMRMTEAYSGQYPSLWNLDGLHLEGKDVSSVSPKVEAALRAIGGVTPLCHTLKEIKEHEGSSGDTTDLAIYISTDGDPTDAGIHAYVSASRLMFEKTVRDLTTNGITVQTSNNTFHTRKVGVSVQYIGDNADAYKFQTPYYKNGRRLSPRTDPEAYYAAKLADVRENGSTGAWLSALDNERKGGIPRFDVVDDDEAEIKDVKRKTGKSISKEDLDLKRAVGMWVPRLDRADEETRLSDGE